MTSKRPTTMFSGIIERVGHIVARSDDGGATRIVIAPGWVELRLGESVAINGACLTVESLAETGLPCFCLSAETLARIAGDELQPGMAVNLERALRLGDRLSGHIVQGHVDGVAHVITCVQDGAGRRLRLALPKALARYCIDKGSIAVNGISLTIMQLDATLEGAIEISVVPHTWAHTSLRDVAPGRPVNIEVDCIAKYVERLCRH